MDCKSALELISARIDRQIVPADAALLKAHLAQCPACRAALAAVGAQDAALRSAFAPRRLAAAEVADRAIQQLNLAGGTVPIAEGATALRSTTGPVRLHPKLGMWVGMIASAAAGFLLAVLILRPSSHGNGPEIAGSQPGKTDG